MSITKEGAAKDSLCELTREMKRTGGSNLILRGRTTPDGTPFIAFIARSTPTNGSVVEALEEIERLLREKAPPLEELTF